MKILIAEPQDFSPSVVAWLRERAEVDLRAIGPEEVAEALRSYDVFWFRLAFHLDATVLRPGLRCRIIATPVTGIDHIDEVRCAQLGIRIVCLRGEREFLKTIRATAELTIGILLSLLRHLSAASASVRAGTWDRDAFRGRELYGKTAGIVGCGRLGGIVATYLLAMGMRVLTYDPDPLAEIPPGVERLTTLAAVLAQSDVISLHVNYHPGNRGMLGTTALAQCKPGAVLVNTSRGGLIDEAALLAALQSGHLAGAALDVVDAERTVTASHPLVSYARENANLLLVPHIGGNTYESFTRTEQFIAERVVAAWADLPQNNS
ncbi:NAD(P)-dependent oxidoreductase [Neolewinella lacunae]|uniref:Hydroxyacid dehydrogenase n=1 Tax=Neolewinella lacunae TaxID=1517758 RepID=A0A923T762_9BACT|nr:NAD(P)-dependent oxidoreductase [Neolewinella lacunae]MBC6994150.1 hypothetical protein [Neolewinella lacunae]MDN3636701.1 NAD(P)-dependent oxidoreductase [Neolewinella lacunae]